MSVFISYRREDTRWVVKNIYDNLLPAFSKGQVFMDIDGINFGDDFIEVIENAVAKCDTMLVVIGKTWLSGTDKNGRRRIDDPADFVRIEIKSALERKIRIIPVLVDGAGMPGAGDLPADLKLLSQRQAFEITHQHFKADVQELIKTIRNKQENVGTKKLSQLTKSLLAVFGLFVLAAGAWGMYKYLVGNDSSPDNDRKDWELVINKNDSAAYANYLKTHPNGIYKDSARQKLDSLQKLKLSPAPQSIDTVASIKPPIIDSQVINRTSTASIEKDYFQEGLNLYGSRNFKEAIPYFLKAKEFKSKDHELLFYLGYAYYAMDNYSEAVKYLQLSAEASNYRDKYPLFWLGYIYSRIIKDYVKGLNWLEKLTVNKGWEELFEGDDDFPYVGAAYYWRGHCKIVLGFKDEGCIDIKKSRELAYSSSTSSTVCP